MSFFYLHPSFLEPPLVPSFLHSSSSNDLIFASNDRDRAQLSPTKPSVSAASFVWFRGVPKSGLSFPQTGRLGLMTLSLLQLSSPRCPFGAVAMRIGHIRRIARAALFPSSPLLPPHSPRAGLLLGFKPVLSAPILACPVLLSLSRARFPLPKMPRIRGSLLTSRSKYG